VLCATGNDYANKFIGTGEKRGARAGGDQPQDEGRELSRTVKGQSHQGPAGRATNAECKRPGGSGEEGELHRYRHAHMAGCSDIAMEAVATDGEVLIRKCGLG